MTLLLDTHIALWAIFDSPNLTQKARSLIHAADSSIWVSSASIWEISMKRTRHPADMPLSGSQAQQLFTESGFHLLAILPQHAAAVESQPFHHKDPFDRMLVTQALVEGMSLITHDKVLAQYGNHVLLV